MKIICEKCERPISEYICPDMVATNDRTAITGKRLYEIHQELFYNGIGKWWSLNVDIKDKWIKVADSLSRADL